MNSRVSLTLILTAGLCLAPLVGHSQEAPWAFGIGSGFQFLHAEGDVGFTSFRGAENVDLDLDPSDFRDLMDSVFGFSFFAAKDKWRAVVGYGTLTLLDRANTELVGGALPPLRSKFEQTITFAEAAATYHFATTGRHFWSALVGVRNTRHEYDVRLGIGAGQTKRKMDHDWTDAVLGFTHTYALRDRISWNNRIEAGLGQTDSFWAFNTSLNWQFARAWNLGFYIDYKMIDFENDSAGDSNWYLYDADEFGPGISIMYTWGG